MKRIKEGKTSLFSQDAFDGEREKTVPIVVSQEEQQKVPKTVRPISKQRKGQIAREALGQWKSAAKSVKVTR